MQATFGPNAKLPGTPYILVQKIGSGAMGDVYEAYHLEQRQTVALKVMATRHLARADLADRMKIEAATLGRIQHKNLVALYDTGFAEDGRLYFAMELLRGHTLRRTIDANAPVRPELAIELCTELLAGLDAAHAADVVHRDIKPENVFVCASGEVKLLDFGVAKVGQLTASLTQTGFQLGTPRYMSPEQIEGKPVSGASDLYAVGLVLFELLTRRVPFEDDQPMALAFAHATRAPPSPSSLLPAPLPPRLEAAVLRALAKSPAERFPSARAFADELAACVRDGRAIAPRAPQQTVRMEIVSQPPPEVVLALSRPFSVPPPSTTEALKKSSFGLVLAGAIFVVIVGAAAVFLFASKAKPLPALATSVVPVVATSVVPVVATSVVPVVATSVVIVAPSTVPAAASSAPGVSHAPTVTARPRPTAAPSVSQAPTATSRRPRSGL